MEGKRKSVWKALNTDDDSESFTIIPTTHQGNIETVIISKVEKNELIALHLWQEHYLIENSKSPLYSGYFSRNKIAKNWGMTNWQNIQSEIDSGVIMLEVTRDDFEVETLKQQYFIKINQ